MSHCRVGMAKAANVHARISQWMQQEGHTQWRILYTGLTYQGATRKEREAAEYHGCAYGSGGPSDTDYDWCVYQVWGGNAR